MQTLATFDVQDFEELANAMNNLSFVKVLELWKARVADVAEGERAVVLKQQFARITHLQDSKNALIHGMWTWSMAEPEKVSTTRVSKKQVITMHFPAGSLADFHNELGVINSKSDIRAEWSITHARERMTGASQVAGRCAWIPTILLPMTGSRALECR